MNRPIEKTCRTCRHGHLFRDCDVVLCIPDGEFYGSPADIVRNYPHEDCQGIEGWYGIARGEFGPAPDGDESREFECDQWEAKKYIDNISLSSLEPNQRFWFGGKEFVCIYFDTKKLALDIESCFVSSTIFPDTKVSIEDPVKILGRETHLYWD